MNKITVIGLAAIMCYTAPSFAELYRWVDKDGNIVYSQTPPLEQKTSTEKITVDPPPPATSEKTKEKPLPPEIAKKVEGNPALDPKLRQEYCAKGRKNLELLKKSKPGTGFVTEDKKLIKLNAEDLALKIKESEAVIRAYCD